MDTNLQLTEPQRGQLDGIVQKMTANGESDSNIQFVVNDFKQKYGAPPQSMTDGAIEGGTNILKDIAGVSQNKSTSFIPSVIQSTIGSKGLAGVAQLPGKVAAGISEYGILGVGGQHQAEQLYSQASDLNSQAFKMLQSSKTETDPAKKEQIVTQAKQLISSANEITKNAESIRGYTDTTGSQALGTTVNAELTALTGAKPNVLGEVNPAFQTLSKGTSFISPTARAVYYGGRAVENAVLGAGFNTASNLEDGKPITENLGTAATLGATLPIAGTLASDAVSSITSKLKPTAEGLINSLIKPLQKDFAYGKNPARGILNEGIVANDLPTLQNKVNDKLTQIGSDIGKIGTTLTNSGVSLDLSPALAPLDEAMKLAAKNNNPTLLNSLNNVKIALSHDLSLKIDEAGNAVINKGNPKNLSGASYRDAVNFLSDIRDHTRFTGNVSDDKALNLATKRAYGITRSIMNNTADGVDPAIGTQIRNLNERFADLSSARSAIAHRDIVMKRQNIVDLATKLSVPVSITGALLSGSWSHAGAILASEAGLLATDKLLGSAGAKTRIAKFLNAIAPTERNAILDSNNPLKNFYRRMTGNQPAQVGDSSYRKLPVESNSSETNIPITTPVKRNLSVMSNSSENNIKINNGNNYYPPDLPTIDAGKTPISKFKKADPNLPVIQGKTTAGVATTVAGATGVGAGVEALNNGGNKTSYSSPQETQKQSVPNIIEGIDISKYATDPQHEQKVTKIYNSVPETNDGASLDTYIKSKFPNSPITGNMIYKASKEYGVAPRLLVAIMQQDSGLGTKGLAVKTLNPGNVANNDAGQKFTYSSWQEGVRGVARFLAKYKLS